MDNPDALLAAATRHTTPCGDGDLVWHRWGPAGGAPVVLLHGGSGSWTHWLRNIAPLAAAGHAVWVADMPGFGDSAAPPDGGDADVLPGWLETGLQQLLGATPVAVVGFSFGALVAGLWAQARPARVARLVLVGSPGLSAERLPPLDLRRWDSLPPGPARLAVHRHNLLQLMLAHAASATPLAVTLHAANVERDRLRQRRMMLTDAVARLLPQLACPVHGIWGALDVLYAQRLPLIGQVLATAPGHRSLVLVPEAGHWVAWEAAEAFNAALAAALADGLTRG
ncbi:alpha/beta fold hydrolase [Pseudaquabacterium pictum]|uniref:Dihydrolipoamide acetyltransferase n=1 Tax=Pseudaquabacterium pictum TaxID=2315236 RepID=A0A480AQI2_9BURK|nr:alpha/beta fold hydrolase [Rubrivivax pictus]GCL63814.1 dihydrolipoamide acetyltransferase [Rubrivivax pictus]